jgi:hypothetical protein
VLELEHALVLASAVFVVGAVDDHRRTPIASLPYARSPSCPCGPTFAT